MRKTCILAALATCAFAPAVTSAVTVTPIYSHLGSADFDGSDGDVKTTVYGIIGENDMFTFGYTKTSYDFSRFTDVDLNKLFGDVRYTRVNPGSIGYFVGAGLSFGWEDDFNISENYSFTPRGGINYNFDADWTLSGGVAMNFNEIENYFMPILTLAYRDFNDLGFSGIFGTYNRAQYRFSQALAVEGNVRGIDREIYQLADKSRNGAAREGYLMERAISASAGVVVTPIDALTLRAGVEARFDREIKLYNKNGDKLTKNDVDPSYGLYINGTLSF